MWILISVLRFVFAVALSLSLTSCAAGRGHQNFINIMQGNVGRSLDDPYIYLNRNRNLYVTSKVLPNGNVEQEFDGGRGPTCKVFFEIDKTERKVVGWRYEGSGEDCAITP